MDKFKFGKNWNNYIKKYLNEERVQKAIESLQEFTGLVDFKDKTFVDIGCGSGLFSLAAYRLGAKRIVSMDVDEDSVECCKYLSNKENNPTNWEVITGDALDEKFINYLGKFDIVYSWGVLHHTGNMWKAISNIASLTAKGSIFYLAIYNNADGFCIPSDGCPGSSKFWGKFKKWFIKKSERTQNVLTNIVAGIQIFSYVLRFKNPFKEIENYRKNFRGMTLIVDIKDWLGGYPYEYASASEIFLFMKNKGFLLENLKDNNGLSNNEFLFRKI